MAWGKEYQNWGAINFNGSTVKVYKSSNSFLIVELGSGKIVEMSTWAGDAVNVTYTEGGKRRVRKYTSTNQFIQL